MSNDIKSFIEKNAIKVSRGVTVYKPQDAIDLISLLEQNSIPVYGIEGFYVNAEGLRPSMADSTSASTWLEKGMTQSQTNAVMVQIIKDRLAVKDLFFDITFKNRANFRQVN